MEQFAISVLLFISGALGIKDISSTLANDWIVKKPWIKIENGYLFQAQSEKILESCASTPDKMLLFPRVVHSTYTIYGDGNILVDVGNHSFDVATPFYHEVSISCKKLSGIKSLVWEVRAYSKYFARIIDKPKVVDSAFFRHFTAITANLIAAGVLIIVSLFSLLVFYGRTKKRLLIPVVLGGLCFSVYFLNSVNSYFGIQLSMLTSHKLADFGLWLGACFFFEAFFLDQIIKQWMRNSLFIIVIFSLGLMAFGQSGDVVQLGTILPMGVFLVCSVYAFYELINQIWRNGFSVEKFTRFLTLACFLGGINDILNVFGLINTPMLFALGIQGAIFGLSVTVNQEISKTYNERDQLLINLENQVDIKTNHLSEALVSLKTTQAELVQSARLASLGTMSAGIAHEINNSINYVSGALRPLERKVAEKISTEDFQKLKPLFNAIREGTQLTVDIIKSLRNYTGLNHANAKEISVAEVVKSVITILRSRLSTVKCEISVPEDLIIFGSMVGLNQI
ncbi:MAG: hypothetical protein ACK5P5_04825, partial [Pseudobdellovibrionaceae bacterium]